MDGTSEMAPGSAPNCTQIVNDSVTLTGANGDTLLLVNSGEDCIFVEDGGLVIRGTGIMQIVGGTGRFAGATGLGTWVVAAPVTSQTAFPPAPTGPLNSASPAVCTWAIDGRRLIAWSALHSQSRPRDSLRLCVLARDSFLAKTQRIAYWTIP